MRTYKKLKKVPRDLPPEPVEFRYTRQQADVEYKECHEVEEKWRKKLKLGWKVLTPTEAVILLKKMCDQLGVRRYPRLYCYQFLGGTSYCCGNKIVIAYASHMTVRTLLHELAHFVVSRERLTGHTKIHESHGRDYLWVLDMLYQAYEMNYIKKEK
jgi:hypothetical protein